MGGRGWEKASVAERSFRLGGRKKGHLSKKNNG